MGKDKSEKKEKKEKRSEKDGVKKSKKDKKSKLSDENVVAAFEEAAKEIEKPVVETKALVVKESIGEVVVKPVGALVPFANPLADDKVTKKVLKSVKKGRTAAQSSVLEEQKLMEWKSQRQRTRPSSAESKKLSRPYENRLKEQAMLRPQALLSSQLISRPWMLSPISLSCAKITTSPTSSLRAEQS